MKQIKLSGSNIYAKPVLETDDAWKQGRCPSVGARTAFADGRRFVYCGFAPAGCNKGELVGDLAPEVALINPLTVATPVGSDTIVLNLSTYKILGKVASEITANSLVDCLLSISNGAGTGHQYVIQKNTAATGTVITITLQDAVVSALDTTTSDILISANKFNLVGALSGIQNLPIGVVVRDVAASSTKRYAWVQYAGVASVSGACAQGLAVVVSDVNSYAVANMEDGNIYEALGTCIQAGASHSLIELTNRLD